MNIELLCIGRLKDPFFEEAAKEYVKRLGAFGKIKITELPAATLPEKPNEKQIAAALAKEATQITAHLPKGCAVYPMCIEGKQLTSEGFARELQKAAIAGMGTAVFIIGGSYGLDESVKKLGKLRLSMSAMTFPHRLARIMLLEQIYRAMMIADGRTYHK
ncbi:MAG: 23S rRNA (pseudouridine(1915)-N(3))-methyltransferase RlmH [Clostridia bacterium]|nr:23S rRNA (pseudouridine(1915)-N(3))-methyltransferase RlmH [Clostridia bacterium]